MRFKHLGNNHGKAKIWSVLLVLAILAASAGIGIVLGLYCPITNFSTQVKDIFIPPFRNKKVVRILMLGEDNTGGTKSKPRGLSDTIILMQINLDTNKITALSIPRDTAVDIDGSGHMEKINAAHMKGGPLLVESVVQRLTGIAPDYYLKTNVAGFAKSVDLVGGVMIDVEKNMNYDDNWGHLHIHLKKGYQLLNGEQAMGYVRFRHDKLGDITRMQRQQKFLKAFAKRALEPQNLPKLPQILADMKKHVFTDMSLKDIYTLAKLPEKVDMDAIKVETLPAIPQRIGKGSYMIADETKIPQVIQDLFLTTTLPGLPKVEILNGSGQSGVAQQLADFLKAQGYEVVSTGNADSFKYESNTIVAHKKDIPGLDRLSQLLVSPTIKNDEKPENAADVTVIIGKNFVAPDTGG